MLKKILISVYAIVVAALFLSGMMMTLLGILDFLSAAMFSSSGQWTPIFELHYYVLAVIAWGLGSGLGS